MSNLFITINVFMDGIKTDNKQLKDDLIVTRQQLCDKLNGGWIDRYNMLMEELDMVGTNSDEYENVYLMITNGYWTKLLHNVNSKYKNIKIESEVLRPITSDTYDCQIKLVTK